MLTLLWSALWFIGGGIFGVIAILAKIVFDDYWQWAGSHGPFSKWADRQRARGRSL